MIKTMNNTLVNTKIDIQDLGKLLYKKTWNYQKELLKKRSNNEINDTLILV